MLKEVALHKERQRAELEALLFAAAAPLSKEELASFLAIEKEQVENLLQEYEGWLEEIGSGLRLQRLGDSAELVTAPSVKDVVEKLRERPEKLSPAALETLAVIAFKQPVTKAEVEEVRGVSAERIIKQLLEKNLIQEMGRKDSIGKPILYGTTDVFLKSIGASSLEQIKEDMHTAEIAE